LRDPDVGGDIGDFGIVEDFGIVGFGVSIVVIGFGESSS
jgi:hypothetical protein